MRFLISLGVFGLLFGGGGCFDEIIPNPGASGSSSTTGTTGAGATMTSTSASGTDTSPGTDHDSESTSESTSDSETGADQLTLCTLVELCDEQGWQVEPCEDCAELTPVAQCVLFALESAGGGTVRTKRCDQGCILDHYALRAGPEVFIESVRIDEMGEGVEVVQRQLCNRIESAFFDECLEDYTEACADPAMWVVECEDYTGEACPFTKK